MAWTGRLATSAGGGVRSESTYRSSQALLRRTAALQDSSARRLEKCGEAAWSKAAVDRAVATRSRAERLMYQHQIRMMRGLMLAAADTERHRIAADIHDGAQQHLSALRIRLGELAELTELDPAAAGALARRLGTLADQALDDLRRFVHRIYPAELRNLGLVDALREAARVSPIPVAVRAHGVLRYSEVLENAVYFTCLEAVQNAIKHAPDASAIRLTLIEQHGRLEFDVTDDGPGIARDAHPGVGFSSMHARIAYVSGRLAIEASSGRGTRVHGSVPIPPDCA